jgi:hypothetical protein
MERFMMLAVRNCVGDRIQKIIDLIQEICELPQISTNFATRITNFK